MVNIVIHPYNQSSQKQDLLVLDFQGSFDSGEVADLSLVKFGNVTLNEVTLIKTLQKKKNLDNYRIQPNLSLDIIVLLEEK